MNCNEAKTWIDRRIQAEADGDSAESQDWSVLSIHLASCPNCQADLEQLRRTRTLLHDASSEGPNPKETENMFTAIAASAAGPVVITDSKARRNLVWQMAVASVGVAAILGLAFQLGNMNLGPARRALVARSHIEKVATSSRVREAADSWDGAAWNMAYGGSVLLDPTFAGAYEWGGRAGTRSPMVGSDGLGSAMFENVNGPSPAPPVTIPKEAPRYRERAQQLRAAGQSAAENMEDAIPNACDLRFDYDSSGFADAVGSDDSASSLISMSAASSVDTGEIVFGLPHAVYAGGSASGSSIDEQSAFSQDSTWRGSASVIAVTADPAGQSMNILNIKNVPEEDVGTWIEQLRNEPGQRQHRKGRKSTRSTSRQKSSAQVPTASTATRQAPLASTKIIKTGTISTEVERYGEAIEQIERIVAEHGGFVADASTREQKGGALSGSIKIRVSPPSFEGLFAQLKTIGRLESEDVKASDVTAQYVDLESRIGSLQVMEDRLGELVKNKSFVDKVSALLEVERELKRVRTEREQLVGQLRVMSDRIGLSTITMTLHEPSRTVPSAALGIEVGVLEEAAKSLGEVLVGLDGRLVSGETRRQDNGTRRGEYQIEVRLPHFRDTLTAIENLGRVEQRQTSDQQFGNDQASWAAKVPCHISLVLHERWRPLPAGTMQLEVDRLEDALGLLNGELAKCESSIISNETTRRNDGSNAGELKLRIPAGRFSELISAIDSIGRITAKSVSGDVGRIVGGAASQSCELRLTLSERTKEVPRGQMAIEVEAFAAARTALSQLIKDKDIQLQSSDGSQRSDGSSTGVFTLGVKANDMETVVTRLDSLGRVRSRQIRGIGLGDLSRVDPESVGVIQITLYEPSAISPGPEHASGSIRARLRDGLAGMYNSFGLIVSGLIIMVPWVLLIIVPAWLLTRALRKRKAAQTQASAT